MMNIWVAAIIATIVVSTAYSYYRQMSFSIVVSVVCMVSFALLVLSSGSVYYTHSETMYQLEFIPHDLTEPGRMYTVLTSMYTHGSIGHLLFNLLVVAFIATGFEQRIGTRPYMLLYFMTGLCGTLAFAGLHWGSSFIAVVGASGAISGVLGAYVRMFPHERFTLVLPLPLPPMPLWVFVAGFLVLQFVFLYGATNIAVESHLGGLIAGYALAPYVARLPLHRRVRRMVSMSALRKLAKTPELKAVMRRIEDESIPDVKSAWIEHFLSKAECPHCGAKLKARKEGVICDRGHML
jgi:membrane associated rhomboid family serine protease